MAKYEATGPKIIHDKNSVNFRKNEIHTVQATDKGKFFIYKIYKLFNYKIYIHIYKYYHPRLVCCFISAFLVYKKLCERKIILIIKFYLFSFIISIKSKLKSGFF